MLAYSLEKNYALKLQNMLIFGKKHKICSTWQPCSQIPTHRPESKTCHRPFSRSPKTGEDETGRKADDFEPFFRARSPCFVSLPLAYTWFVTSYEPIREKNRPGPLAETTNGPAERRNKAGRERESYFLSFATFWSSSDRTRRGIMRARGPRKRWCDVSFARLFCMGN